MKHNGHSTTIGLAGNTRWLHTCVALLAMLTMAMATRGAQIELHTARNSPLAQENAKSGSSVSNPAVIAHVPQTIMAYAASFYPYDVRTFGAKGDGVTDDTSPIQMAINAAASYGGGVVYFPKGVYKVGHLILQPTVPQDRWMVLLMDGSLYLTETLEMNTPAYALIGRSGGLFNSFQQYPSAQMEFDPSVSPVIHISTDPIYLEGITLTYVRGDGILIDNTAAEIILKRIFVQCIGNGNGSPLRVNMAASGFGLVINESTFAAPLTPGTHAIELRNFGRVKMRDSFLINRGIFAAAPNSAEASGYSFDNVLYEGGLDPFLSIDSTSSYFTGIDLENVEMADPAIQPNYLIANNGSGPGYVTGVFIKFSRSNSTKLVGGNRPIYGLYVYPDSSTDSGHVSFLGQDDFYTFYDKDGVSNIARLLVGSGGTPITKHLSILTSVNFSPLAPQAQQETSITLAGASIGDSCDASPDSAPEAGLVWSCYVSAQDTITVRLVNPSATTVYPASRNWRIDIWEHP